MPDDSLPPLGATVTAGGVSFAVWAPDVARLDLVLGDRTLPFDPVQDGAPDGLHRLFVPGIGAGQAYALNAGEHRLVDPYALALDRPYGPSDVPRAIVTTPEPVPHRAPRFRPGGTIYELAVRPFTMLHPDVPEADRGTLRALAHPAVIAHLRRLGIDAVELMPVVAWIDERHLAPLGLTNGWGYNPVTFFPMDPRLGTLDDLRASVAALHDAGIDVILDLVFNHTGESDIYGRTLSFRGLANHGYYRHAADGSLINDTGCGNTVACDHPMMRRMILDTLRHFVAHAGVDGFRFDLAPILGRTMAGFSAQADLLREIASDPLLADRILIAEPWDIGPGGYQLGRFAPPFLEWSDRYRDDVRLFWRGDPGRIGALATRLAGSSDIFGGGGGTGASDGSRTVNFLAAHDGFTLADLVAHEHRHNLANGEQGRDGHGENYSWNNGVEGPTDDPAILAARRRDVKALLSTLYGSRGTIMLTAGDEFGRSQRGNNNAYCQDNAITWVDWAARDTELEAHVVSLSQLRRRYPELSDPAFLAEGDAQWLTQAGEPMAVTDWEDPTRETLQLHLFRLVMLINRAPETTRFTPPSGAWEGDPAVPPRSVAFLTLKEPAA
ncbi:glycogen debranching enzyme GlgX [Sphingobium sufflavum]|uniref:glycogen debranching protein n=1 Tax=Sphingobium sufflavum TaxID=1129547 RepID=UPI001F1BFB98|nr:alpha-amylase family glycosyl hydrolase [Sphingobium sufflavum]MCE7798626.1 glycogen debranching enzyme GlgX [Sphingobium sufflavum]